MIASLLGMWCRKKANALDRFSKNSAAYEVSAFAEFSRLERSMGKLILTVIKKSASAGTIENCLLDRVKHDLGQSGQPLDYSGATYNHLSLTLLHNWTQIEPLLDGISRKKLRKKLDRINYGNRRLLAHPHRAEQKAV